MRWKYYHSVWFILLFTWVTSYLVRMAMTPALVPLKSELGLSHIQAGWLASAFFYAYTSMQVPAGYLGDRLGRKGMVLGGSLGWGIASLLTAVAGSFPAIFATRMLTGLAEGALFSNDRPIITAYTPRHRLGLGQGISFSGLGLGMGLGVLLGGVITAELGWRWTFALFGLPPILAALLVKRFVKEPRRLPDAPRPAVRPALTDRNLWLSYLAGTTAIYTLWVLGTWTPAIFLEAGATGLASSSVYSSLVGFAAIPGLLLSGYLTDRVAGRALGRRGLFAVELAILAALMAVLGLAISQAAPLILLGVLVFLAGLFFWGANAPMLALWAVLAPRGSQGITFGVGNSVAFIGSLVAPVLTGWIRDTSGSFAGGFYLSAGLLLVGTLLALAIGREKGG